MRFLRLALAQMDGRIRPMPKHAQQFGATLVPMIAVGALLQAARPARAIANSFGS
jgi:hypothetical protein